MEIFKGINNLWDSTSGGDLTPEEMVTILESNYYIVTPPIPSPPEIISFDSYGISGDTIEIIGEHFISPISVFFGLVESTTITINSSSNLSVVVPLGAITSSISVTTNEGSATSIDNFIIMDETLRFTSGSLKTNWTESDTENILDISVPAIGPNGEYALEVDLEGSTSAPYIQYNARNANNGTGLDVLSFGFNFRTLASDTISEWGGGPHFVEIYSEMAGGARLSSIMNVNDAPDNVFSIRVRPYPGDTLYRYENPISHHWYHASCLITRAGTFNVTLYDMTTGLQVGTEIITSAMEDLTIDYIRLGNAIYNSFTDAIDVVRIANFYCDYSNATYPVPPKRLDQNI